MSDLPDGLDDHAMISAIAWQIVNYSYMRKPAFNDRPDEDVFVKLTNEFIRARQAIYHGMALVEKK